MNPMIMAAVADYIKNQQQDSEARETGQQQIAQKHAASLGYPTYGMQAAQLNNDIEEGDDIELRSRLHEGPRGQGA